MIPLHDNNPTTIRPIITVSVIVACCVVFLWELSLGERGQQALFLSLGVTPATLVGTENLPATFYLIPPWATVITSMFLHGGWMHLIGNMLYLWIFGNNIEDAMGHFRYIVFYVLCGVAAALAQAIPNPDSTIPMVGASGAISGVLGAYLLIHPRAQVLVWVPLGFYSRLIHLPAFIVLGFWIVLQVINAALAPSTGGGVAWGAHVGGFVAGLVLIPFFKNRRTRFFS